MCISDIPTCIDWEPVRTLKFWRIPKLDGTRTVYLKTRGQSGKESTQVTTTITLSQICAATTVNGYLLSQANGGSQLKPTKIVNIANGTQTLQQIFTCSNETFVAGAETVISISCNGGYSSNGSSCVANSCSAVSSGINGYTYAVPALSNG